MSFLEELAYNIRTGRINAGLTQVQLAQKIGCTNAAISMYELSKRSPKIEVLAAMATAFDMSLDDLVPHVSQVDAWNRTIDGQMSFDGLEDG